VAADLRERVARAIARDENGDETGWQAWCNEADAVLAELKQELAPQAEPVAYANPESIMLLREVTKNLEAVLWDRPHGDNQMALYAAPQPQASAEDVELVGLAIKGHAARYPGCETENAWQRLCASLEVKP
jgi:hypothetical protein